MAEPFVFAIFKELLFVLSISAFLRDADGVNQFVLLFLHLGLCLDAGQLHRFQRLVDGVDKDAQILHHKQSFFLWFFFFSLQLCNVLFRLGNIHLLCRNRSDCLQQQLVALFIQVQQCAGVSFC